MSWTATERFGAHTAPDGLALVQELVNTHAVASGGADLLANQAAAGRWLRQAASQWARVSGLDPPELTLSGDDLRVLRELRAVVRDMLAVPPAERSADPDPGTGTVTERARARLVTGRHGRVALLPLGTGADWLASAIWSEVLLAQRSGAWSRVKLCREPGCRTAFYDASRNGSGAWHNVRTCGNITNLRASRARRKGQAAPHPGPPAAPGSQV
jgi:predicted RNA-binding Zn ribbon-like protein